MAAAETNTESPPPEPEQPSSRENYNLDDLAPELRNASIVLPPRWSWQNATQSKSEAVPRGAAVLVEFDHDPGYDIAIAHLQAVARIDTCWSVDDIQVQIQRAPKCAWSAELATGEERQ